jgi:serine/threonine protein kinase/Tol biopolymer transport system component
MTADRWARITSVFRLALDKSPGERPGFLETACAGDRSLRRNVERLLAAEAEDSLPSPLPMFLAGGALELARGEMLSQYRVEGRIGEGGMGTVYRAYDTRLQRTVALKVLAPEPFAGVDRNHRLLREARAASALNHPNIVTVYEIGSDCEVDFIAMEFVSGRTLAELIRPHGLPVPQVVAYGIQIAGALAKAHAAGMLHRDLKPSNLMLAEEGRIKILDFGLARQFDEADAPSAAVPSARQDVTAPGVIAGTAAYMSPEQAAGRKLDGRSDIFSFGIVLYEMTAGHRPFTVDTPPALLEEIAHADPPRAAMAPVPPDLRKVILRCLEEEPSRRYQTMADVQRALEDMRVDDTLPHRSAVRSYALVAAFVAAALLAGFLGRRLWERPSEPRSLRTVKFTITPANLRKGGYLQTDAEVSVSRDGKHIAYVESRGGQLWIRDIDQEQARPVPGATGVYQAFWSPDGQSVGYSTGQYCGLRPGCDLVRIPVEGGRPAVIAKLPGAFRRASWSSDGATIVYCDTTGMYIVPAQGGPATRVLAHPHIEHPSFLDLAHGRRAFLYQAVDAGAHAHGIYVQVAGDDKRRLLALSSSTNPYPIYGSTGHIIYVDGEGDSTAIWALPFSLDTLQATGKPFRIVAHGSAPFVSQTGTLVYSDVPSERRQLAWVDRSGKMLATIGAPHRQGSPTLSPDSRRLAVVVRDRDTDLWVYDLEQTAGKQVTFDQAVESLGAWTRSGDQLTYSSNHSGRFDILLRPLDGNAEARLLWTASSPERPLSWSPDERFLLYGTISPETKADLFYRERRSDGTLAEPTVFLRTPFNEAAAQFSPDGHFVVYVSDRSGRNEVYLRDFPHAAREWQVSRNGGMAPRWTGNGNEIFYVEQVTLMAASVTTRPDVSIGPPVPLFAKGSFLFSVAPQYDVSADGKRFVILNEPAGEPPLSVHVVHNWFEEFRGKQ